MPGAKYYDHHNDRPLNLASDGCALSDWTESYGKASFAMHPDGFKVFLHPDRIVRCDEYANADPYKMEHSINSEFQKRRIDLTIDLLNHVDPRRRTSLEILDLGCGQGHITQRIREEFGHAVITGLDYSLTAIEYAHGHFPGIDFSVGDAYEPPYANEYFDLVVCNNLWEHVPDPLYLSGRIKLLLKPGGYLILSTPSRYRIQNLLRVIKGEPVRLISPHHVTEYSVGQVIEQLKFGGFQVEEIKSKTISERYLPADLLKWMLGKYIGITHSHHNLEHTVFYLAQKGPSDAMKAAVIELVKKVMD